MYKSDIETQMNNFPLHNFSHVGFIFLSLFMWNDVGSSSFSKR